MPALEASRIADLLQPYLGSAPGWLQNSRPNLPPQLSTYLDLLLRWNARTNLTAIRDPEEIVTRHFGEGLFLATLLEQRLAPEATLLDFGSGAGFPGLPIQLYLPGLRCCLAESQGKKATFLREAVRTLALQTEVWAGRVEAMPKERRFDVVTLRAVDRMPDAVATAREKVVSGGLLVVLGGSLKAAHDSIGMEIVPMPDSQSAIYLRRT